MAKANEIEIVVRGKDDSEVTITRSTKRAEEAAERIRRSGERASEGLNRTRDSADGAADGLTRVGEAGDVTDTRMLGMSNLFGGLSDTMEGTAEVAKGNLLNGMYLLGLGIADLGSGVYNFVVPSLQAATGAMTATAVTATETAATETAAAGERAAAQTAAANTTVAASGRAKAALAATAGFVAGPWGVAIIGAAAVLGAFGMVHMRNKDRVDNFTNSLDAQTGAITNNTRMKKADELETAGWLETAEQAGVSTQDLTAAVLGNEQAYKRVKAAIDEALSTDPGKYDQDRFRAAAMLNGELERQRDALRDSRTALRRKRDATEADTSAVEDNINAHREQADALRAVYDPAFGLLDAQRQLADAQRDYTKAVKEHGPNSAEAAAALDRLAQAAIRVDGAAGDVSAEFDGSMSPALRQILRNAGLTADEIAALEARLRAARREANRWARDWKARFLVEYHGPSRVSGVTGAGGFTPFMAHGGIHGGGPAVINEQGPELVNLPSGSTVIPAGTTQNMLAGGGPVQVVLKIERTGDRLIDALMEALAQQIRVEGGNVQQVLGS